MRPRFGTAHEQLNALFDAIDVCSSNTKISGCVPIYENTAYTAIQKTDYLHMFRVI